jgi:hypothetical protein
VEVLPRSAAELRKLATVRSCIGTLSPELIANA